MTIRRVRVGHIYGECLVHGKHLVRPDHLYRRRLIQCTECGWLLWGYYVIEEEPDLAELCE